MDETPTAVLPSLYILTNALYAFRILVNLPPSLSSAWLDQTPPFTVRRSQLSWVILGHQTEKTFRCKKVWIPRLGEWKTEISHFFSLKTNMTITVLKIHNLNEDGSISYWISGDFPAIVMLVFRGGCHVWINIQLISLDLSFVKWFGNSCWSRDNFSIDI